MTKAIINFALLLWLLRGFSGHARAIFRARAAICRFFGGFLLSATLLASHSALSQENWDFFGHWELANSEGPIRKFGIMNFDDRKADGSFERLDYKIIKDFGDRMLITIMPDGTGYDHPRNRSLAMVELTKDTLGQKLIFWRCPDPVPPEYLFFRSRDKTEWELIEAQGSRIGKDYEFPRCDVTVNESPSGSGWIGEIWRPMFWRGIERFPASVPVDKRLFGRWEGTSRTSGGGILWIEPDGYITSQSLDAQQYYIKRFSIIRNLGGFALVRLWQQLENANIPENNNLGLLSVGRGFTYKGQKYLSMMFRSCYGLDDKKEIFSDLSPEKIWQRIVERERLVKDGQSEISCQLKNSRSLQENGWHGSIFERPVPD